MLIYDLLLSLLQDGWVSDSESDSETSHADSDAENAAGGSSADLANSDSEYVPPVTSADRRKLRREKREAAVAQQQHEAKKLSEKVGGRQ